MLTEKERKARHVAATRAWRLKNKEKVKHYRTKWRTENKDLVKKCRECGELKTMDNYPDYDPMCRSCRYEWKKDFNARTERKFNVSKGVIQRFGRKIVELYKRADWKCESCGTNIRELHVHHKDGKGMTYHMRTKEPMDNSLSNLLLLCSRCHMSHHAKERGLGKNINSRKKG